MTGERYDTATIRELEDHLGESLIRRRFDIRAFGMSGHSAHEAGATVIKEHDERPSGHEELYVVVSGRARFTVAGDELDAPAGALVFVRDPSATRSAVAVEADTTVVAVGGRPGEAFRPRSWETGHEVLAMFDRSDFEGVKRVLLENLETYEDTGVVYFNLACAEAQLGETEEALEHVRLALAAQPSLRENALDDEDLASLRDDPRFAELVAGDEESPGEDS